MARDGVSDKDAFVLGDPIWLSSGCVVDGELQLDCVDDCVVTIASVLNSAEGTLSILAWINGGASGQAIISQQVVSD